MSMPGLHTAAPVVAAFASLAAVRAGAAGNFGYSVEAKGPFGLLVHGSLC